MLAPRYSSTAKRARMWRGAWEAEATGRGGAGAGRAPPKIVLGPPPRAYLFKWSCEVLFQATPTLGAPLELYVAGAPDGDSTQIDGDIGASDAALGDVDMLRNLRGIGVVVSENAAASEKCVASGIFEHYDRYLSLVGYDNAGASVDATDSNFVFTLQPIS